MTTSTPWAPTTPQVGATVLELLATAAMLRRLRLGAGVFTVVQFGLYSPGPLVDVVPWPRWPAAVAFVVGIAAINAIASKLSRSDSEERLQRVAVLEVAMDTTLVLVLMLAFSFDESVRLWPMLAFPILEAAMRLELRGALAVWAYGSGVYAMDQVIRLPTRADPTTWVRVLPFATGVLLAVALVAGLQAARLEGARRGAEARASELRDLSDALREARDAAEQASSAKNDFLSRMSHELRTPMNAVLGFAQLLALEVDGEDERESVEQILKAGGHLLGLIDQVLEISRIEAGSTVVQLEPVAIHEVVREVVDLLGPAAARRDVSLVVAAEMCGAVFADRQRFKQVLLNLVGNGIKYNIVGGSVTVACTSASDGLRRVEVVDTGLGIRPELLDRVFVPFDRLGAESTGVEGTGLGLALSQRLAEAMSGELGVESAVGVGSIFWVDLPMANEVLPTTATSSAMTPAAPRIRGRVLYVEDNASNLRLVERLLERHVEVELLSAMQGRVGLELVRVHEPDLVLLDLNLPDIDGDEVLALLMADERTRHIPVVIITADATPRQRQRLLAAGATGYLTKPLDVPVFLDTVASLLRPLTAHATPFLDEA